MAKTIAFNQDAREAIRRGVGKLTKAVRSTLGPCGHTVLLAKSFGPPIAEKSKEQSNGHGRGADMYRCHRDHANCPGKDK